MKKLADYIVEAEQHLAEQAEQQRLTKLAEIFGKENIKHGVAEAPVAKQYVAAKFIDEFGDGDHWYVKGTPELVQKFVMLANNIEQASMQGTEYEPGQGTMGQIHGQLGNDQSPQWKIVPAKNLDDIKPINNSVINVLSRVNLDEPGDEFMSDFLWRLEEKGLAKTVEDWDQQGVAEGDLRELAPNPGSGGGGGENEGDDGFELPLDFKGKNIMVWPRNKKHSMGDTATPFPRGERFTGKVYIMWDQPKIEAIFYLDPKDREDREKEYERVYGPQGRGYEDWLDHKWYDTTGVRYRFVTDWRLIPAKEPGGWPGIVDAWGQDMKGEVMNYPESFITEIIQKDGDGRHFVEPRQGVAEGSNPVLESRMLDEGGETLDHVLNRFRNEVKRFEDGGDLDEDLYDALYDYYLSKGEMPYGIAKARTGDPVDWVAKQLEQDLGMNESIGLVNEINPLDIPAYRRKDNARLGGLAKLEPSTEPPATVRPENIPAVRRKEMGKDFPVTLDQVSDKDEYSSHIDTLRKMAGLPPALPKVVQPKDGM